MDYARDNRFDPTLTNVPRDDPPVHTYFLYFATHLRRTRYSRHTAPIKSNTINQYICHVVDYLVTREYLLNPLVARSRRLTMLLCSYAMRDDDGLPTRLTGKIPITYNIACRMYALVNTLFTPPGPCLAMHAAIALAFGLSLRPAEYLVDVNSPLPLSHQVNTTNSFFVYGDDAVNVCDTHLYPIRIIPDVFFTMLDHLKNDQRGVLGPRAVAVNPHSSPTHFCCVGTLYKYCLAYPPRPNTLLLSSHGSPVLWVDMRRLCNAVAIACQLDPARLVPHSFRSGAQAQLELEDIARRMQQGGWKSAAGARTYARTVLAHAHAVTVQLHNADACPIDQTRLLFTSHDNVGGSKAPL